MIYGKKFIEFQNALAKFSKSVKAFTKAEPSKIDSLRDAYINSEVHLLKLYNEMLTLVQEADHLNEKKSRKKK